MTNADKFKETFDIYATELWAMSVADFHKWLNADHKTKQTDIVRCKDCKHYMDNNICPLSWECFDGNDFCSHGERRE